MNDVGEKVYNLMMRDYSKCQWGDFYSKLPVELFSRIRIITSLNDRFFDDSFQGMPKDGYAAMSYRMLDHKNITSKFEIRITSDDIRGFNKDKNLVISTAPPDELLDFELGELEYQRVNFVDITSSSKTLFSEWPDIGVINFSYPGTKVTRTTNYRTLACKKDGNDFVITEEPGQGVRAYPVRTKENLELAKKYISKLRKFNVIQAGRLGLFEYINMDVAIEKGLALANSVLKGEKL